jgi:hypothetical protein
MSEAPDFMRLLASTSLEESPSGALRTLSSELLKAPSRDHFLTHISYQGGCVERSTLVDDLQLQKLPLTVEAKLALRKDDELV